MAKKKKKNEAEVLIDDFEGNLGKLEAFLDTLPKKERDEILRRVKTQVNFATDKAVEITKENWPGLLIGAGVGLAVSLLAKTKGNKLIALRSTRENELH